MEQEIRKQFKRINDVIGKNIEDTLEQHHSDLSKLLLKLEMIQKLQRSIDSSCIEVLEEVENDLLNSVIFMTQSFYRNSMMCLRSAVELTLSFIYYTDRNYEFMLWKNNNFDMTWKKLTDVENGVLSKTYLSLFIEGELKVDELSEKIKKCYHECSEYVHGKYGYMQSINEVELKYEELFVNEYLKQANEVIECIILFLFIRFGKEFNFKEVADDMISYWKPLLKKYGGEM